MACTSCSQTTCNCTPTSICETCVDVTSSECIYYKGYYPNSLGLSANFRFNTFAETVLAKLGTLPASINDYRVTGLVLNFADTIAATNTLRIKIEQTGLSDIIQNISIIKHAVLARLNTNSSFAVTTTATNIPGTQEYAYAHAFATDTITIGSNTPKRAGTQLVSASIIFVPASTQSFSFTLYEGSNVLKTITIPCTSNVAQTITLKDTYTYASSDVTKTFTFKVASASNTTINILAGDFEVREYEY